MTTLRLGHPLTALRATLHNGPGRRVGLWVQGCQLRCTARCLNPHLLDPHAGYPFSTGEVSAAVLAAARDAEGVTVLGGEPTEQAGALTEVFAAVRAAGLSTMLYTGHLLEDLRNIDELLALTDLLVDGPFVEALYDPHLAWRGSSNQRVLPLSDRYSPADLDRAFTEQRKAYSIHVAADGTLSASGLQERDGAALVEKLVRG